MAKSFLVKITGVALVIVLMLVGCGQAPTTPTTTPASTADQYPTKKINVAAQNQSEAIIIANMLKLVVESKTPIEVTLQQTSGGSGLIHTLMEKDQVQMYFGYDGSELDKVFKKSYTAGEFVGRPEVATQYVIDNELSQYNIWVSPKLGFEDTYAIAVKAEVAEKYNLKTISDCIPYAKDWTLGVDTDFMSTAMPGFQKGYPDLKFKKVSSMDYNLMYQALDNKSLDAIMAFSTDGRLTKLNQVTMIDDKNYFPPYNGIVLINNDIVKQNHLDEVLKGLWGSISTAEMTHMNELADVDKVDPAKIAKDFLVSKGII